MGNVSVSDPVRATEMRTLHGGPEISGLNELSEKSMEAVITEQSCGYNIRICSLEDDIMNYLERQSKAFIIEFQGRAWGFYILQRFKISVFITIKVRVH